MSLDVNAARLQMVNQQVRAWNVLDERVLDAMSKIRREDFVPAAWRSLAFGDVAIPLPQGRPMLTPKNAGKLLQALALQPDEQVLLIGAGSGYLAACLGTLADKVLIIEPDAQVAAQAQRNLRGTVLNNVSIKVGDGMQLPVNQQYDAIAVTGSLPIYDERFQRALKIGGRLFAVVGTTPSMEALRITRTADNTWRRESLFDTELPALANAPRPAAFVF